MSARLGQVVTIAGRDGGRTAARQLSTEERRRLVDSSLHVGNPRSHGRDLPAQSDPNYDCPIELKLEEVRPYEYNPRRSANSKFAEIKESIRAVGIRTPLTVTRRPGEQHFIVEAGGNTRLLALRELWEETRDPRFERLTVLFRPWRSDTHVISAHLIENEQRGEMSFWDKACGLQTLKARLEEERGGALTLRLLEEELAQLGLSVNTATIAHCLFATERLRTLGERIPTMTGLDVRQLQPRLNLLKKYAQARTSIAESDLYASVFEPVFARSVAEHDGSKGLDVCAVYAECEVALAGALAESVEQLRAALSLPEQTGRPNPQKSFERSGDEGRKRGVAIERSECGQRTPVDGHEVLETSAGPPTEAEAAGPTTRIRHEARLLAGLAAIDNLIWSNDTFSGYTLAPLADAGTYESSVRYVWLVLACVAPDLHGSPGQLDADFLLWLTGPCKLAEACRAFLGFVRETRASLEHGGPEIAPLLHGIA